MTPASACVIVTSILSGVCVCVCVLKQVFILFKNCLRSFPAAFPVFLKKLSVSAYRKSKNCLPRPTHTQNLSLYACFLVYVYSKECYQDFFFIYCLVIIGKWGGLLFYKGKEATQKCSMKFWDDVFLYVVKLPSN